MPKRPATLKTTPAQARRPVVKLSPSLRGYGRDWQRVRLWHLAHSPLCLDCADRGIVEAATEVDHVLRLEAGGTHDADNLRSLCKACHARKTVEVDGGLGHAKG